MGSLIGSQKIAAKKIGISYDDYIQKTKDGLKWCFACKTWKQRGSFDIDRSRGDGLSAKCIECSRLIAKKVHRGSPPSKKVQSQASSAVSYEIKKGTMLKASLLPCRDCGKPASHYHHHLGYARRHWLDVIPLCVGCHRRRHYE